MPTLAERLIDEGKEVGYKLGLPVGIEKGIAKHKANVEREKIRERKDIAVRMLHDSPVIKTVAQCTGLTEEDIKKLIFCIG